MKQICLDLTAEHEELDRLVANLDESDWNTVTPFYNWTIKDEISHLAYFDDFARMSAVDEAQFNVVLNNRMAEFTSFDTEHERINSIGRNMPGRELLAWWRKERSSMVNAFASMDPKKRVPWFGPPMSARSSATARLMETWAHGQDIYDALKLTRTPTDPIRHVAHIGVSTFKWSFANRGMKIQDVPIRVELISPGGEIWTWGPEDAENRVNGPAVDFCLIVTQRRNPLDMAVRTEGEEAGQWMKLAQAFAGPPEEGPPPGYGL